MPKTLNKLNDAKLRNAKPPETGTRCLGDGGGLRLLITHEGYKRWQMEYVSPVTKKRRLAGFGSYPEVSLTEARENRNKFRQMIRDNLDPLDEEKKADEALQQEQAAQAALLQTFEKTAEEWFAVKYREKAAQTQKEVRQRLVKYLFPVIGDIPMTKLKIADLSKALDPLFDRVETCKRVACVARQVCRYAVLKGYTDGDVSSVIMDILPDAPRVKHMAAITDPKEFGRLLLDIDDYPGDISTLYCLKILPYVFVRSNEIRNAKWSEIDLEEGTWMIPAERMKMKKVHFVPLARQVVELLRELQPHTGYTGLLFPSSYSRSKCISDMCLLNALRRMGYDRETMTVHGFRSTASTLLNERLKERPDVVEAQLAHSQKSKVQAAYRRAEYEDERREMMQRWGDYIDGLKAQAKGTA